jgi:sugar phosphate isomerase/epimerase
MMKICLLTDEISADPETALELGVEWGIHDFELRGYFLDRVPILSPYQKRSLLQVLERYQANVVAISPGLFKFPFPAKNPAEFPMPWLDQVFYDDWSSGHKLIDTHLNSLLPQSLDFANEVGAKLVISFGFARAGLPPGPPPDELLETLHAAAERAKSAGLRLAIENESGFWADTGERTAHIVRAVNHPSLGVNWDPGNAFCEGELPYPNGYAHVKGLVTHVHFKDAMKSSGGTPEYALEGEIDWTGQIRALAEDGYTGHISVESHLRPKVAAAHSALKRLLSMVTTFDEPRHPEERL